MNDSNSHTLTTIATRYRPRRITTTTYSCLCRHLQIVTLVMNDSDAPAALHRVLAAGFHEVCRLGGSNAIAGDSLLRQATRFTADLLNDADPSVGFPYTSLLRLADERVSFEHTPCLCMLCMCGEFLFVPMFVTNSRTQFNPRFCCAGVARSP